MAQMHGKQIKEYSIKQKQLDIDTNSITEPTSVVNVEYVNSSMTEVIENLSNSTNNLDMLANDATVGELACDTYIVDFPTSNVEVRLNGIDQNIGETKSCYFSPDEGVTIREGGLAQKGDFLYWNSDKYNLEADDELDFVYLVYNDAKTVSENSTITLDSIAPVASIVYTGAAGTTADFIIDGVTFVYGNVGGFFTWDIGGLNETTLVNPQESLVQEVNGEDYTIWFDGFGSHRWSCRRGHHKPPLKYFITTVSSYPHSIINVEDNNLLMSGNFSRINQEIASKISILNQDGSTDSTFNSQDGFYGNVEVIVKDSSDKYIVGGGLTKYQGNDIGKIIRLNADGSIDDTFVTNSGFTGGDVEDIIIDSNGKYIVTGAFTAYKGLDQFRIARLNQDGSLDTTFNVGTGFNGTGYSIIEDSNNKYVICGSFSQYKGLDQFRIIRLNQDGSLDATFIVGTGFNSNVNIVTEDSNNKYVIGGSYSQYKSLSQNRIARLNQDGSLDATFVVGTGFNSTVYGIAEDPSGKYAIAGFFSTYNGNTRNRILKLNSDGSLDNTFDVGDGLDSSTYAISIDSNGKCIVGGNFATYNNIEQKYVARINTDGSLDTTFDLGSSFDNGALFVTEEDGKYLIGGNFNIFRGVEKNYITKITSTDGAIVNGFDTGSGFSGSIRKSVIDENGKYIVVGGFITYKGLSQNRIARLNPNGSLDTSFNIGTGFNSIVEDIIIDSNGKYLVSGNFTTYNDISQIRLVRLNTDGSIDNTFDVGSGFNVSVTDIIEDSNNKYVVAGQFYQYKGISQKYIARLEQDGSLDTTFVIGNGFNGHVRTLIEDSNNKYVVGGSFTSYQSITQNKCTRLNHDGSIDQFDTGSDFSTVYDILEDSNGLYVMVGTFTEYKGNGQSNLVRMDKDGNYDSSFNIGTGPGGYNSSVTYVEEVNEKYYVGGNFNIFNDDFHYNLIRLNQDGSNDSAI